MTIILKVFKIHLATLKIENTDQIMDSGLIILMPSVMVLGGRVFGKSLGHEVIIHGGFMNGISAIIKETPQNSLFVELVCFGFPKLKIKEAED